MKIVKKKTSKKSLVISILAVVVIAIGLFFLMHHNGWWPFSSTKEPDTTTNIDLLPPTDEQVEDGYSQKDDRLDQVNNEKDDKKQDSSSTPSRETNTTGKQAVTVTITNYRKDGSTLNIGAIVDTSEGGECTVTLASPSQATITATSSTVFQSSYVSCAGLSLQNVTPGSYTMTVSFSNSKQEGRMSQDVQL